MNAGASSGDAPENPMYSVERKFFARNGYATFDGAVDLDEANRMADKARTLWKANALIEVAVPSRRGMTRFQTLNGQELVERIPEVAVLHERFLRIASEVAGVALAPLDNAAIGISMNVTPAGGQFQYHYDRNLITALVYLNAVSGGEMIAHPRLRFSPAVTGPLTKMANRCLDGLAKTALMRGIARKVVLTPKAGRSFIFEGRRTLHAVQPVQSGEPRISVQLAYDLSGVSFSPEKTGDYYGYRNKKSSDS